MYLQGLVPFQMYMNSAGVPGAAASLEAGRLSVQFSSVQLFSRVQLFETP